MTINDYEGVDVPVAVITETDKRFELKSLPGAYVVIKRMTYGQKLNRQQLAMKMFMKMGGKGKKQNEDTDVEVDIRNRAVSLWSFANLIIDHNLTDENERALNFKNVADVEKIDGRIGEEIDKYIDEVNNFEDDAESSEEGTLGN